MICPSCQYSQSYVVDSRDHGRATRRRRECNRCKVRFTTIEEWRPQRGKTPIDIDYYLPTDQKHVGAMIAEGFIIKVHDHEHGALCNERCEVRDGRVHRDTHQ